MMTRDQIYKAIGYFEAQRDYASHEAAEHFDIMIELAEKYLADLDAKKPRQRWSANQGHGE